MFNGGNSEMLWLIVVNVALGLVVLTALVATVVGAGLELVARVKKRKPLQQQGHP